jgi:hypothetical protein
LGLTAVWIQVGATKTSFVSFLYLLNILCVGRILCPKNVEIFPSCSSGPGTFGYGRINKKFGERGEKALFIRLNFPGPVIFVQKRNGNEFLLRQLQSKRLDVGDECVRG